MSEEIKSILMITTPILIVIGWFITRRFGRNQSKTNETNKVISELYTLLDELECQCTRLWFTQKNDAGLEQEIRGLVKKIGSKIGEVCKLREIAVPNKEVIHLRRQATLDTIDSSSRMKELQHVCDKIRQQFTKRFK